MMDKSYPLSSAQFDIYLDQLIYPTSSLYSVAKAVFINTPIDASLFKQGLQALFEQHDSLRLRLCGEKAAPRQEFLLSGDVEWQQVDLSHYQGDQDAVLQWLTHEVNQAIDMFSTPLYRFYLIKLSANRYCWLHKYHHLIADGWTIHLYTKQVLSAYFGQKRQQDFFALKTFYTDFIAKDQRYLSSSRYQQDKNYWLSKMWPMSPALVKKPLHDKKPTHSSQLRFHLDAGLKTKLLTLAKQEQSSLQQIWLAAIYLYFFRIHAIHHLVIGLSLANRANSEEKMLGGMLATTIPVAITVDPDSTVQQLLHKISVLLRGDYKHRQFPIAQLVKLLEKHHSTEASLFQVAFTYHSYDYQALALGDIVQPILLQSSEKQLPLSVWVIDSSTTAQPEVVIDFNEHYFSYTQALVFKRVLLHLLATLADFIQSSIGALPLISTEERQYLLKGLHNNTYPRPANKTIKDLISAQFLAVPDNISFIYQEHALSYRVLSLKVNSLAALLRAKGVVRGAIVPVCMEQGLEIPIALLAVLHCGAAFFNLDPKWPELRLKYLLAKQDYPVLLTNVESIALQFADKAAICLAYQDLPESPHSIDVGNVPDDLIYCFSTSGTTGEPKIAQNIHRGILNRFFYMNRMFDAGTEHRILQTSGFNFDSSIWQLLWPLCNGATVVMPEPLQRHNIRQLLHLIRNHGVTMTDFVPSFFAVFVDYLQSEPSSTNYLTSLAVLLIGGEEMDIQVTNRFKQLCPWVRVFNTYGPTETSIGVIFQELHGHNNGSAPLGRPIDNVYALILDTYHDLCPFGSPGELYLTGECVGVGYLGNPAATHAAFIDNPFTEIPYPKLYKTGDKVCYGDDEAIYFLGRVDEQVKINGIRIEPKEIALTIEQLPNVKKALVTPYTLASGRKILVAYVQCCAKLAITENEIIAFAKSHLPLSMIPEVIEIIDEFPLLANGKLNIKALPKPGLTVQQSSIILPSSPHEQKLLDIWQTVLEKPIASMTSHFFALGGNSLLFVSLITQVEKQFNIQLPYKELSELLTLASMSEKILVATEKPLIPQPTIHQAILGSEPIDPELYRKLLLVTADWQGVKQNPDAIMTGLNTEIEAVPLFWCLQNYAELAQLGLHFAGERPVYGLRSGHNVMEYTRQTIYQLASHYVKEILELPFSGPYIVGGNCQGALIAMSVAKQLWMNDKEVRLLFAMEESPKNLYHGRIAMIFGRDSKFNPYQDNADPMPEWSKYYRGIISYDEISGKHGKFFYSPNIETLVETLKRRIKEVTG